MSEAADPAQPSSGTVVMRWFTRARRFPKLIGKAPGGGRYPLGPYTMTQAIGAGGVFILGQQTQDVWGPWGFWGNNGVIVLVTFGTLFGLRLVKPGGRDPISSAMALVGAAVGPTYGRYEGKRIRIRGEHQAKGRVNARLDPINVDDPVGENTPARAAAGAAAVPAAAAPQPVAAAEATVVQQLLAQVRTNASARG